MPIYLILLILLFPSFAHAQTPSFSIKVIRDAFAGFDAGFASGVIFSFSKNLAVTNRHVVITDKHPLHVQIFLPGDQKRTLPAKVIYTDSTHDIAILEVQGLSLLGQKDPSWNCQPDPKITHPYFAYGNPFNQGLQAYQLFFSGYRTFQKEKSFVLNPALPPGFSGSALVNPSTYAIEGLIYKISGSAEQPFFTYATPASIICDLFLYPRISHPLSLIELSPDFKIIKSTHQDLQVNDEIISVNGDRYSSVIELYERTRFITPLPIVIKRNEMMLELFLNPPPKIVFWGDSDVLFSSSGCLIKVRPQSEWQTFGWQPGDCFLTFETKKHEQNTYSSVYSSTNIKKSLQTPSYILKEMHYE